MVKLNRKEACNEKIVIKQFTNWELRSEKKYTLDCLLYVYTARSTLELQFNESINLKINTHSKFI